MAHAFGVYLPGHAAQKQMGGLQMGERGCNVCAGCAERRGLLWRLFLGSWPVKVDVQGYADFISRAMMLFASI